MRTLATLAAFALLACALSYWGWRWFGPASEPLARKPVDDFVAALSVAPPFGIGERAAVLSIRGQRFELPYR